MVRDSGWSFRLTFCNDIGRLVSFPYPISSTCWIELLVPLIHRLVKLFMWLGWIWLRSTWFFNPVSGPTPLRWSVSFVTWNGDHSPLRSILARRKVPVTRYWLWHSKKMWRPNPDLQLACDALVTPVKSGDWIYIILDGVTHCTAHLQVRWLCRVKSMKHELIQPILPDTFQLGLCFE